jgi:putative sterol carrier protein
MAGNKEMQAEELIKSITDKINANAGKMKEWDKAFRIVFKDANAGYLIKVSANGTVERVENETERKEEAVATITTTTETLQNILRGVTSPISAMMLGQIQVEGSISNLMKLGAAFM